jgi:hypothetical protein
VSEDKNHPIQSQGGKARAEKLSGKERKDIARNAALARWSEGPHRLPRETHEGTIEVLGTVIPCGVLEDGTRIFSTRGVNRVLGSTQTGAPKHGRSGAPQLPSLLASESIRPFISSDLMARLNVPREYRPKHGGRTAFGHEATILPELCGVILDAREERKLGKRYERIVRTAKVLNRAFAKVGVIALVDEATGYQDKRPVDELRKILEAYIAEELRPWLKTFPDEFFRQIYRLQEWEYKAGVAKRTPYVGKLINNYVYEQLPPGVLDELRRKNPVMDSGYRRHKHFQLLTADTGSPHLDKQIVATTAIMKVSDDQADFEDNFDKAYAPYYQQKLPLKLVEATQSKE